jgi:hypothetical protein
MGTNAETAIIDYSFSTKKNKLPFSVSVCIKQMEVCRAVFRYSKQTEVAVLSISSVFRLQ